MTAVTDSSIGWCYSRPTTNEQNGRDPMTDKKTTKSEKQAVKKQPIELQDDDLDTAQGGAGDHRTDVNLGDKHFKVEIDAH